MMKLKLCISQQNEEKMILGILQKITAKIAFLTRYIWIYRYNCRYIVISHEKCDISSYDISKNIKTKIYHNIIMKKITKLKIYSQKYRYKYKVIYQNISIWFETYITSIYQNISYQKIYLQKCHMLIYIDIS